MLNFKLFHNKIHSQLLEALLGRLAGWNDGPADPFVVIVI